MPIGPAAEDAGAVLPALGPRGLGTTTICGDGARAIVTTTATAGVPPTGHVRPGLYPGDGDGPVVRRAVKPLPGRVLANVQDLSRNPWRAASGRCVARRRREPA